MLRTVDVDAAACGPADDALTPTLDAAAPPPSSSLDPADQGPRQVGRFVLLRLVGKGGMGAVYAAYDERLDRKVAIKLLRHSETVADEQKQRVLREAQAMARVSHPNVVSVFEVGEVDSRVFIAMEFVDGMTLSEWQRDRPRSWPEILRQYLEAGEGLCAAHEVGLVHRDFKPDNVLLSSSGRPRVADFGLARLGAGHPLPAPGREQSGEKLAAPLTQAGAISGTPGYMSPEQYSSGAIDARSDQFSFCAALYEALYGRLPFAGDSLAELAANTVAGKAQPRPAESPIPMEVHEALLRGLSVEPSHRFPSMNKLLAALRLEQGHTVGGAAVARRRFVNILIVMTVVLNIAIQSRLDTRALSMRDFIVGDVVMLVFLCGFGAVMRNTLLRNAFHWRIWLTLVVFLIPRLGVTLIGLRYQIPIIPFLAMNAMTMAGMVAILATLMLPRAWWVAPFLAAVSTATAVYGSSVLWLNLISHPIAGGGIIIAWNQVADHARRQALGLPEGS